MAYRFLLSIPAFGRLRHSTGIVTLTGLFLLGLSVSTTSAQVPKDPFSKAGFDSTPLSPQKSELPTLRIQLAQTFQLQGPLDERTQIIQAEEGVWVLSGGDSKKPQWVALKDGISAPALDSDLAILAENENQWRFGEQKNYRYGVDDRGRLVAQKCCGFFRKGWRNKWKQRLPGKVKSPPLVFPKFVLVTASDNKIYSVRRRNGHVLWSLDAGERVSRPLAKWVGPLGFGESTNKTSELVIMVPDQGDRLVLLDAATGQTVAEYPMLDAGDKLLGSATVTDQGEILVLLEKYDLTEAALLVFSVETVQPLGSSESSG